MFIGGGGGDDGDEEDEEEYVSPPPSPDFVDHNCFFDPYRPSSPVGQQLAVLSDINPLEPVENDIEDEDGNNFDTVVDEIERQLDESEPELEPVEPEHPVANTLVTGCSCGAQCKCSCHSLISSNRNSSTNSSLSFGICPSGGRRRRCSPLSLDCLEWDVSADIPDGFLPSTTLNDEKNSNSKTV